jgi:hypothetical protein
MTDEQKKTRVDAHAAQAEKGTEGVGAVSQRELLMKTRQYNRRAVEGWIMGCAAAKEMIAELETEIAEWGLTAVNDGMPHATGPGDPTLRRAVKMSAVPELAMSRRVVRAVESVYARCPLAKRRVMEEYFFHRKPYHAVCRSLNLEKTSVYRYAAEITREVAELLGLQV